MDDVIIRIHFSDCECDCFHTMFSSNEEDLESNSVIKKTSCQLPF